MWNWNDLLLSVFSAAVVVLACQPGSRAGVAFRGVSAVGSAFAWIKLLGSVKVLRLKLATYVYALQMIVMDLLDFSFIMVIAVLMFAVMLYTLHAPDQPDNMDDLAVIEDNPFLVSPSAAVLGVFIMLFGQM